MIARHYGVSTRALARVNHRRVAGTLRAGERLLVPTRGRAASAEQQREHERRTRPRGVMHVVAYRSEWHGHAVSTHGKLRPAARAAIGGLLGATGSKPHAPSRLVELLVQISDHFGGRTLRIVSGYRTRSFYADSRHKHSAAVDFRIDGVSNRALCDYLRTLSNVGVGYYPNSSFVHLDVRGHSAYWVDYAGPGEEPRSSPRPTRRHVEHLLAELDALGERAVHEIQHAGRTATSGARAARASSSERSDAEDEAAKPRAHDEP